jgi:hypothetical protein
MVRLGQETYIVNACRFSVYTDNQFCPLPLLLAVAQAVDLSRNNATFSMVEGPGKSRQHIWLVYSVLGSHGDYGIVMLSYTVGFKKYNSWKGIFRPLLFFRRSTSEASQKKKLERAVTNSDGGAVSVGFTRMHSNDP